MKRVALIVNPMATAVTDEAIDAVAGTLDATVVLRSDRRAHAIDLVRDVSAEADAVVVFAGDGGFNEALNGLPAGVPVGFVPGGGTSVLSRALGLSRDPVEAARTIRHALDAGRARLISVGRVNGRRFGFSAGLGLDAEFVRRVDALGRSSDGRRPGDVAFLAAAARVLGERRFRFPDALEVSGLGRAAFALVANCDPYTYVGRIPLRLVPEARFELGLDLVAPISPGAAALPRYLAYSLLGRGQEKARDVLYRHDVDRIDIRCDEPMPLQVDGEDLGDVEEAAFEAERGAVAVLV